MESFKQYLPNTDEYVIGLKLGTRDTHLAEAHLLRNAIVDAEKLLTKIILRKFLQKFPVDSLIQQININDIIARSLKINISLKED